MANFAGRNVIITGGTGALGSAVVQQLLDADAVCHVPCLHEKELAAFSPVGHDRVRLVLGIDLTSNDAVTRLYGGIKGPLWASIHLAGGFVWGPIASAAAGDFESQWRMNALTCWLCCRAAVAAMRSAGGGRIINVTSRPGITPEQGANMTAYTAAKAAVSGLTVALAAEVASDGIWVNAVAPSIMDTPANRTAMPKADFAAWVKTDDVARTIVFLASPENTATRGGLVPVYGRA